MKLMAKNLAIAASAGSGKTYNLAHRYIGLLAKDASPERIVALTFSRKAAAEIFSSVIAYLARAAEDESAAAAVGALLGAPYPRTRALADLKRLLAGLHRLTVGTLDSFAIRILQSFPLHFHLGGGFAIIDDNPGTAHFLQRQVIMRLLASSGDSEAFRTAFRQASFGREERRLSTLLAEFIADCQDLYLEQPEAAFWGVPPLPGWGPEGADPAAAGAALLALVEPQVKPALLARWQRFVEEVAAFDPAVPLPRPLEYLLTKACEVMPGLLSGRAALAMERCTVELDEYGCRLLTGLLRRVFDAELTAAAARAQGIHRLVADYETAYERLIRRRGQLTYNDVQRLLARERFQRPDIDARLDASLDHWLLDEFQDTSTLQWLMLANLADEVIQDDDPGRSFFYVGDVKQAIYGWRQGNAELFGMILDHYGEAIARMPLNLSYRSCPPVIDCVNAVFGRLPAALPAAARRRWAAIWGEHASAAEHVPAHGCALLLESLGAEGKKKADSEDRYRLAAALLNDLDPVRRRLSCALLVRSNRQGAELANLLRRLCPDLPVVHEGVGRLADNPVVTVLCELIRFAAHPGDTMSRRILEMSPLHPWIAAEGGYPALPARALAALADEGFASFLKKWGQRLPLDGFGRRRLEELLTAAMLHDRSPTGSDGDPDGFLEAVAGAGLKEEAGAGTVRVMTIHQSKGLGFDIVILPDLQDGSLDSDTLPAVCRFADADAVRMVCLPRRPVAMLDPKLAAFLDHRRATAAFDELCLLYVALTRAKRGLYLIVSSQGQNPTAYTAAALCRESLTGDPWKGDGEEISCSGVTARLLSTHGEPDWHRGLEPAPAKIPEVLPAALQQPPRRSGRTGLARLLPSATGRQQSSAAALFAAGIGRKLALGSLLHLLLEQVEWLDDCPVEEVITATMGGRSGDPDLARQAATMFRQALASPEIRALLGRPAGDVQLWREQSFDVVAEGRWLAGTFDRVVIHREGGKPVRAVLIDFKSNEAADPGALDDLVREYRPQLLLYRQALARLLKLGEEKIEARLALVATGRVITVA